MTKWQQQRWQQRQQRRHQRRRIRWQMAMVFRTTTKPTHDTWLTRRTIQPAPSTPFGSLPRRRQPGARARTPLPPTASVGRRLVRMQPLCTAYHTRANRQDAGKAKRPTSHIVMCTTARSVRMRTLAALSARVRTLPHPMANAYRRSMQVHRPHTAHPTHANQLVAPKASNPKPRIAISINPCLRASRHLTRTRAWRT